MGCISPVEAHPVRVVEHARAGERRRHGLGLFKTEWKRLHREPELIRPAGVSGERRHRLSRKEEPPGDVLAGITKGPRNHVHGLSTCPFLRFARLGSRAFSPSARSRSTCSNVATIPSSVWKKRSIASSLCSYNRARSASRCECDRDRTCWRVELTPLSALSNSGFCRRSRTVFTIFQKSVSAS